MTGLAGVRSRRALPRFPAAVVRAALLLALAPCTAPAARAAGDITVLPALPQPGALVSITADRADWLYPPGAHARLRIQIALRPYPAAGVPIRYRLGPEMIDTPEREARVPAEGLVLDVEGPPEPGFVRLSVTAGPELPGDDRARRALATLGFGAERIEPTQIDPADFDAFWAKQQAELAKVEPDLELEPAAMLSTPRVEVFYLSFRNVGGWEGPSRLHGVLAVPRATPQRPGPFPALLNLPGAGVRGYRGNVAMAEQGFITLQMGVHGLPVNLPADVYDDLSRGALRDYNRFELDDRERYYYRRVYLGMLRASHVLAGHAQWDGRHLLVAGGSQGGQLALVVAALNPRVSGVAVQFPAFSDTSGYLHGRAGGWPGLFRQRADGSRADAPVEPKLLTTRYYDSVNFARRVRVPVHCSFGFNDEVTPPTSTFAACNAVTARKQLLLAPAQGHSASAEQNRRIDEWLRAQVQPAARRPDAP